MTLLFLFIALSLILAGSYLRFFRDPMSPAVILTAVYLFSIAVAIVNIPVWHTDISLWTAFVIFSGLSIFLLGSLLAFRLKGGDVARGLQTRNSYKVVRVRATFYVLSVILMGFFLYSYNEYINHAADSVTTRKIDTTSLELYRDGMVQGDIDEPVYITIMKTTAGVLAAFYLLVFINNCAGGSKQWKYLIPVFLYALSLVLSSGRIGFIYLIVIALVYLYLVKFSQGDAARNSRFIWMAVGGVAIFIVIFLTLGNLTNKTQQQDSIAQNISIYAGSSIVALDDYLTNPNHDLVEPGPETSVGIANLLQRIGVNIDSVKGRFLEFRSIGDMPARTNIYTSLRRLIHDFGYYGMLLIQFISGYAITALYVNIRKDRYKNKYFAIMVYALLIQFLALSSTDERLIVNLITISTILTVAMYFIFTRYMLFLRNDISSTRGRF